SLRAPQPAHRDRANVWPWRGVLGGGKEGFAGRGWGQSLRGGVRERAVVVPVGFCGSGRVALVRGSKARRLTI
ncbi:hypothetical protein, partial [Escherichia coli]|uniref:hypothetical protein n=1 Tax=Escherichia coli TaxID=562 RepID=UPI00292FCFCE